MKKYYVYQHIRHDKNEVFYIGIGTKSLQDVKCNTYSRAYSKHKDNSIWLKIVNKTSWSFEILYEYDNRKEAEEKEKELILLYGRKFNNTGILANFTLGGEKNKGYLHTLEAKNKISKRLKGKKRISYVIYDNDLRQKLSKIQKEIANRPEMIELRRNIAKGNSYHLGHKHSEESKKRMRESAKKRGINAITIKCKLIDIENNIEWEGESIKDLSNKVPISLSTLNRLSQGIKVSKKIMNTYKFIKL